MTTKVLQFIGKGQLTIPQEWRSLLELEENAVKATLYGNKIIIESFPLNEEKQWLVEPVLLNSLPKSDKKIIKQGRAFYKKGKKNKFLTAAEFFKN